MISEGGGVPRSDAVSLERAGPDRAPLLSNLLELYIHDMSEVFPVKLGPDGRFGYERLSLYWSAGDERLAFLIKHAGDVAGFALVTRGSPVTTDPADLDVAEFFVLRSHRRAGVGRRAAGELWDSVRGHWVVRVSEANRAGLRFWSEVVRDYSGGTCEETVRPGHRHGWRVFTFASRATR
jgi:predicted acetyltransferase